MTMQKQIDLSVKKSIPVKERRKKQKELRENLSKLSQRQLLYRKYRLEGKSIFVSAVKAGYSRSYAATTASRKTERLVRASIIDELELAGATNDWQAEQALKLATEADTDSVRLNAQEFIAKLKKQVNVSQAGINNLIPDDYEKLVIVVERKEDHGREDQKNRINAETEFSVVAPTQ